jgi:hypothetical protein
LNAIGFTAKEDEPSRLVLLFANEDTTLLPALLPQLSTMVDHARLAVMPSLSPSPSPSPPPATTSSVSPVGAATPLPSATPVVVAAPSAKRSAAASSSAHTSGLGLGESNSDDDNNDRDDNDDYRASRRNHDDDNDDDSMYPSPAKKSSDNSPGATKKAKLIGEQAPLDYDDDDSVATGPEYDVYHLFNPSIFLAFHINRILAMCYQSIVR